MGIESPAAPLGTHTMAESERVLPGREVEERFLVFILFFPPPCCGYIIFIIIINRRPDRRRYVPLVDDPANRMYYTESSRWLRRLAILQADAYQVWWRHFYAVVTSAPPFVALVGAVLTRTLLIMLALRFADMGGASSCLSSFFLFFVSLFG